jgi:hypothetical protein
METQRAAHGASINREKRGAEVEGKSSLSVLRV